MSKQTEVEMNGMSESELGDVLAVTREFAAKELVPHALALDDRSEETLAACWRGLCEIGLQRGLLPESDGGVGLSLSGLLGVLEELAVGDGGVAALTLLSNAALALLPKETLSGVGESERYVLVPLPEPGTPGSTSLTISDKTASGSIPFVLGGFGADGYVIVGRKGEEEVAVLVEAGAEGLSVERDEDQLGLNGAPVARVECDNTPLKQLGGAELAIEARILTNAGIAAIARGISRRSRDIALDYAENRFQGGSMIIEYGAIIDMIAKITERNRVIAGAAAFSGYTLNGGGLHSGKEALAQALAAKAATTEAAAESTTDAVQVLGGMGYMHEMGVEKLMRDARYCQLFPQSNWLARDDLVALERA